MSVHAICVGKVGEKKKFSDFFFFFGPEGICFSWWYEIWILASMLCFACLLVPDDDVAINQVLTMMEHEKFLTLGERQMMMMMMLMMTFF
jgi:hypothetical protein